MKFSMILQALIIKLLRYERIVFGSLAAILLIIGYLVVINPLISEINQSGVLNYQNETQRLKDDQEYLKKLSASVTAFRSLNQSAMAALEKVLPAEQDLPGLFVYLDDLVARSGLSLASITTSAGGDYIAPTQSAKDSALPPVAVKVLNVQLSAAQNADYGQVKAFLANLEQSQRILDVVSLTFNAAGETTPVVGTTRTGSGVNISLKTYYLGGSS